MRVTRFLSALAMATIALAPGGADSADDHSGGVIASFEGRPINLAESWEEATACTTDGVTARCYRSEAEMDAIEGRADDGLARACTPTVRLWSNTGQSGQVLKITSQYTNVDLAPLGFDNITSSYKVGGCNSYMYDGAGGGAPQYPGTTSAGASYSSMASGWDNRVSSFYIG